MKSIAQALLSGAAIAGLVICKASGGDLAADYAAKTSAYQAQQLENLTGRRVVPTLQGQIVPEPVTVQGTGHQTIAVGNIVVNPGVATGNVMHVECPLKGGQIVVVANSVTNLGFVGGGAGPAGVVVVNCPLGAPVATDVDANQITNLGIIDQH